MSDGGAQHKIFGPYWDSVNSTMYQNVYIFAFAAGTSNAKIFWTDEDKVTAVNNRQGDNTGTIDGYFDGNYKIEIRKSDGTTVIKTYDNVKLTSDTATMWEGNQGTAYPSVTSLNDWQLAVKRTAGNVFQELGINDGTAFRTLLKKLSDDSGHVFDKIVSKSPLIDPVHPDYGAVGDGVTDDTASVQAAINAAELVGGTVYLQKELTFKHTGLILDAADVTITGGGTLKGGSLVIGNTSVTILNFDIDNVVFDYDSIVTGKHCIELKFARVGRIRNCIFKDFDKAIYVQVENTSQHARRIQIHDNQFLRGNYCLYTDRDTTTFPSADLSFINNMAHGFLVGGDEILISHLYLQGMDGFICIGNYFFFPGSGVENATKEHNIYMDYCTNITISGNNLFEAGLDAILIKHFQSITITGNQIIKPGQRDLGSGINLVLGDTAAQVFCHSCVTGNTIMFPTKHGIHVEDNCGYITITGNQIRSPGNASAYYGSTDIGSITHYCIKIETTTTYINITGNISTGTGQQEENKIQGINIYFDSNLEILGQVRKRNRQLSLGATDTTIDLKKDSNQNDGVIVNHSSGTTVTAITNGFNGMILVIRDFSLGNTTIQYDATNMLLAGGVNALIGAKDSLTLIGFGTDGNQWQEIARSF